PTAIFATYPVCLSTSCGCNAQTKNIVPESRKLLAGVAPYSDWALTAWRAFGSLKYRHHFGLDCFSIAGEHWTLQASLAHSIKDDVFVLSCACGLDASALAGSSLDGFVGGKICSVGGRMCPVATTFTGFSSKVPLSAHPARARARDAANSHFIFAPMMQGQTPHHGSLEAL